eukprot:scaffold117386_cov39-Tisochrysis_lutea.AAC.1
MKHLASTSLHVSWTLCACAAHEPCLHIMASCMLACAMSVAVSTYGAMTEKILDNLWPRPWHALAS